MLLAQGSEGERFILLWLTTPKKDGVCSVPKLFAKRCINFCNQSTDSTNGRLSQSVGWENGPERGQDCFS